MQPIFETISFYPFSSHVNLDGSYSIEKYDIVKHQWITIENRCGIKSEIDEYVRNLNIEAGKISERFIVRYME